MGFVGYIPPYPMGCAMTITPLSNYGQLGHGDKKPRSVPTKVESLDGLVITKISCGAFHTAALIDKGDVLTWYVRS